MNQSFPRPASAIVLATTLCLLASHASVVRATDFGYSLNLNFGAEQPIRRGAGVFGDQVWNNLRTPQGGGQQELQIDFLNDNMQSPVTVQWESPSIGFARGIETGNPDDANLMGSFLQAPTKIVLSGVDQVLPPEIDPDQIRYSLVIYTYGGREGAAGQVRVNGGRPVEHVDSGRFLGEFREGLRGNIIRFPNLRDPDIDIDTEGQMPINAVSLIYCRHGDFNGDGVLDVDDLDVLNDAVKGGDSDPSFDVNFDMNVDSTDILAWIKCSKGTCVGDVNLDGTFDSADLVELFQAGNYETDNRATWRTGDFNGDCKFDSSDLVLALQEGCYDSGAVLATSAYGIRESTSSTLSAVPEPWGHGIMLIGFVWVYVARLRQTRT